MCVGTPSKHQGTIAYWYSNGRCKWYTWGRHILRFHHERTVLVRCTLAPAGHSIRVIFMFVMAAAKWSALHARHGGRDSRQRSSEAQRQTPGALQQRRSVLEVPETVHELETAFPSPRIRMQSAYGRARKPQGPLLESSELIH